ncbi:MAG TPA: hypothetical protein DEA43_02815 [Candidatus Moranbacteria bacterium]|nr:hypothetical protein [Candidatus Moranbacteria bacterium]HBT45787.1 hypothetical protein [Candidatus Moranbacteria bacterium]
MKKYYHKHFIILNYPCPKPSETINQLIHQIKEDFPGCSVGLALEENALFPPGCDAAMLHLKQISEKKTISVGQYLVSYLEFEEV